MERTVYVYREDTHTRGSGVGREVPAGGWALVPESPVTEQPKAPADELVALAASLNAPGELVFIDNVA